MFINMPENRIKNFSGIKTSETKETHTTSKNEAKYDSLEYLLTGFKTLLGLAGTYFYMKDLAGRYTYVSQSVQELFGAPIDEIIGQSDNSFFDLQVANQLRINDRYVIESGDPFETEEKNILKSGHEEKFYWSIKAPIHNELGEIIGICGISTDITSRKKKEQFEHFRSRVLELITIGSDLSSLLESILHGIEEITPESLCSILLLDDDGKHLLMGAAPSLPDFYNLAIDGIEIGPSAGSCGTAAFTGKRVIVSDIETHPYWAEYKALARKAGLGSCWSQPIRSSTGKILGTFAIYHHDIHTPKEFDLYIIEQTARLTSIAIERKQIEDKVTQLAFYDSLTKLANRTLMMDRLGQALINSKRTQRYGVLMFLDLDNFKPINDQYGHATGDILLVEVANRLKSCVREIDTVARFGGDEFVVMIAELDLNKAKSIKQAKLVAEKILKTLSDPYQLKLKSIEHPEATIKHLCTSSIGITMFGNNETELDETLRQADRAMYRVKDTGGNQFQFL